MFLCLFWCNLPRFNHLILSNVLSLSDFIIQNKWIQPVRSTLTSMLSRPEDVYQFQSRSTLSPVWLTARNLKTRLWGHVMATEAYPQERSGKRVGHQVGASALGFSRTHTACGAAGLAGQTSVCSVQAGWMSRPTTQPAKWTSCTHERPSGICGLMSSLSQPYVTRSCRGITFSKAAVGVCFSFCSDPSRERPHPLKLLVC